MEVTLAGGLMVDVATREDLQRHHDTLARAFNASKSQRGDYIPIFGQMTAPTGIGSGPLVIPFNPIKPVAGKQWALQFVSIYTVVAGPAIATLNAAVLIGSSPVGPGAAHPSPTGLVIPTQEVVIPGLAVPTSGGVIIPGKVLVRPGEQLYCVLQGAGLVAGTEYHASAAVIEADLNAESVIWI